MITLQNISKCYKSGKFTVKALNCVSLEINQGEFIAIMGPSGSGKSTLLHVLGLLDAPDEGTYLLRDRDTSNFTDPQYAALRKNTIGFVFQQYYLMPRRKVLRNVRLPLIYAGRKHLKDNPLEALAKVGLEHRSSSFPRELSGGERQRVAIARALVNTPSLILADEPTGNLDSKNEQEVMEILARLNEQGKTIIVVTHESSVARYANRIVRIRDGMIVSDEITEVPNNEADDSKTNGFENGDNVVANVVFLDYILQAFHSILAHKVRSFLSMVGILIGTAAVVAMMALGAGARESIADTLSALGTNMISVVSRSRMPGSEVKLEMRDVDALSRLSQIKSVSPVVYGQVQVIYGNQNWDCTVQGTGVKYANMHNALPVNGRFLNEKEIKYRQKVIVLGATVAKELFGDANPVYKIIKVNKINFKVIGVLPELGGGSRHNRDNVVIIPFSTAMKRVLGKKYFNAIDVEVKSSALMEQTEIIIEDLIINSHKLKGNRIDGFRIYNLSEVQRAMTETTEKLTLLLGSIAALSLLVGGIGIMNVMLVSVKERTKEIGIRKAVGARKIDIMIQFVIEAIILTVIGGLTGIGLGVFLSFMLTWSFGWETKITLVSVVMSTSFCITVGLVFGVFPATQAAKLRPIEALKYE
jgi:macrolide transport system ATP-binding/permease protein